MENNERDLFRLQHIDECTSKIIEIVIKHKSFESFNDSWISQDAMIRNFEVVGEAISHISEDTKSSYSNIEWQKLRG